MGEEEKKPAEEKIMEEKKTEVKEEGKRPETEEKKDDDGNKKTEVSIDSSKDSKEETPPPPPPPPQPPQEIILKVYMHCEGCARKVRRCLKGFEGVENVMTDCKIGKVVVKGEKADPLKVLERVQRKTHRQVELLSPVPPPPQAADSEKKGEGEKPKVEEKKEEPPVVVTVLLRVRMHCEACAMEIKKRIQRMKGVESAEADLKSSQVTVKGVFEPPKLVEYVYKRTGKHAVILKIDPPPPAPAEAAPEEKKEDETAKGEDEVKGEEGKGEKDKKKEENKEKKEGGDGDAGGEGSAAGLGGTEAEEVKVVEVKKIENPYYYYYYPPRLAVEMYAYPPQIFSDENPNACTVM